MKGESGALPWILLCHGNIVILDHVSVNSDPINTDWSHKYIQVNVSIGKTLSWLNDG